MRGNKRIIDELESTFLGAGWNVIKVIWGADWDELFARDHQGLLLKRMEECVDGDFQAYKAKGGAYLREHFFGKYPELLELVKDKTDDQLIRLHRGGHDPAKIYNAYKRALEHKGGPTVILAMTVKGYGLGSAQARNATHSEKKLSDESLAQFVEAFDIPLPETAVKDAAFYRPQPDDPAIQYMQARRQELGGYLPVREVPEPTFIAPKIEFFKEWLDGSRGRSVSTTLGFVGMLRGLLKEPQIGKLIVPIVPDEGRTFGLESVIKQVGIYAPDGQKYTPHDSDMLLSYREEKGGQILEEGITEAGAMASFTAAGTSYANYHIPMVPFYMYYSMFGFQRIGDMAWAFADSRGKGFLMGGTAGRTTMLGEGLQHQDGHSPILSGTIPTCITYDPAYVYEMAVIIQDGLRRMYEAGEDAFYYITMYNEDYAMPAMPEGDGVREGILRGIYKFKAAEIGPATAQLFGSGPILNEALRAQQILGEKYAVAVDVWSVTSYNELRRDCLSAERWNRLHPAQTERKPFCRGSTRQYGRPNHRGKRLHEVTAGFAGAMAGSPSDLAGHGWLWPVGQSGTPAPALRGRCRVDRRGYALEAGARGNGEAGRSGKGLRGAWAIDRWAWSIPSVTTIVWLRSSHWPRRFQRYSVAAPSVRGSRFARKSPSSP